MEMQRKKSFVYYPSKEAEAKIREIAYGEKISISDVIERYVMNESTTKTKDSFQHRTDRLLTRENLLGKFEQIPNVSDQFVLLSFFEGIIGKGFSYFYHVKPEDFHDGIVEFTDWDGSKVSFNTSEKLAQLAKESADQYVYTYDLPDDAKNPHIHELCADDPRCIKDYKIKHNTKEEYGRFIVYKLKRMSIILDDPGITPQNLLESGKVETLRQIMREKKCGLREAFTFFNESDDFLRKWGKINDIENFYQRYRTILEKGEAK